MVEIPSPAGPGSGEPFLADSVGHTILTWIEKRPDGKHALESSRWDGARWTAPATLAPGAPLMVNGADVPSVLVMKDGGLVAHWMERPGSDDEAYNIMVSRSTDGGTSWSAPLTPHRDGTPTEHGFVSLVDLGPGRFGVVWLDGRKFHAAEQARVEAAANHGREEKPEKPGGADPRANPRAGSAAAHTEAPETSLMFTLFEHGSFGPEQVIDPRVCDCCQTTAVATRDGLFVAYRDRSSEEVRDIAFARWQEGAWSAPSTLQADGWKIDGCPVNGPSAAAEGDRLVVAWFTQARDEPKVVVVFSADGGRTFGPPVRVDAGKPIGRVDVEWLPDGAAYVCWVEKSPQSGAELRVRRVRPDGSIEAGTLLATMPSVRGIGFPRLERSGSDLLLAWTDPSDPPRVRVARVTH